VQLYVKSATEPEGGGGGGGGGGGDPTTIVWDITDSGPDGVVVNVTI